VTAVTSSASASDIRCSSRPTKFNAQVIAAGTVCSYLDVRWPEYVWRGRHLELAQYVDGSCKKESPKNGARAAGNR
jgi:hypothetical protein